MKMAEPHNCVQEGRLTAIETKMKHKRYELNDVHDQLTEQAKNIDTLVKEVTKLATILQETQNTRKEHGDKIDSLEMQVAQLNATLNTLKWVITISIALFGGVLLFLITNLIQLIH